jgi:hypothetical protein
VERDRYEETDPERLRWLAAGTRNVLETLADGVGARRWLPEVDAGT